MYNFDYTMQSLHPEPVNRRQTKSLHCPQLDHHDADGLAGHKTWRTAQTTIRIINILAF
jgi:hypothetical protein